MRIYLQDRAGEVGKPASLEEVKLTECGLLWVDLQEPSEDELALVGRIFDIHPVALEECSKESTLPKVQEFANHLFIIWHFLRDDPATEKLESTALCMFLGENYLLTVHGEAVPEIDRVLGNLEKEPSLYKGHPAPVLYSILDTAVDEYFPMIEELTEQIDTYMESLLVDQAVGDLKTILTIKHRNMAARRMVVAHRDVVMKLARRDIPFIPEDLSVYIMDVYDHLVRISAEVDNNSDLISSSLDIHLNAVSNRLNVTMKRLATIALIFMPLTFLVGLYGMNFRHMPELNWQYGYLIVWIVLVILAVVMIVIAKVKGWF